MDAATPWHELFLGYVGAGSSLAGLSFIAIALNPHQIERIPLLRFRALGAVAAFAFVLFVGLTVLTPAPYTGPLGAFSGAVALIFGVAGIYLELRQVHRAGRIPGTSWGRVSGFVLGPFLVAFGGIALAVWPHQTWVYFELSLAASWVLIFAIWTSWVLVLQIGVPPDEGGPPPRQVHRTRKVRSR